ncbi:Heparan sulfate glucosamine 3-O-sulfotransferase [Dirofilaria immitis]
MEKSTLKITLFTTGCILIVIISVINITLLNVRVSETYRSISETPLYGQYDSNELINIESVPLVAPLPARRRQQRLPQCLIIGVRKGGTRALLDALAIQPYIRVARREMHFFNDNETYAKGSNWYRRQMPHTYPEQVTIEKTPAYFTNHYAPERVHRLNSSIKLILILRDPVIRTISDFTQVLYTKHERNKTKPSFEVEAFLNDSFTINVNYKPVRNSLYSLHMDQWLKYFSLKNFLILDGDKFIVDPMSQLRKVERFLRIPESFKSDQLIFNKHKGFYCFRRKDRYAAKCLGNTKGRPHVNIMPQIQLKLRKSFRPYNAKFFKMVNQWWNWDETSFS